MATPAYTQYDSLHPVVTDTRQVATDKSRTNLLALRDAAVSGRVGGWTLASAGGTAEEPATKTWSNGVERIRATITWSLGFVIQVQWDWSNDSGATYSAIQTETANYDGANNMTTGNNSSWLSWLYEVMGKLKSVRGSFNSHIAGVGTAVHGLGSMATQAANAVAISGGVVACTYEREAVVNLGAAITASTAINWALGGFFTGTITGAGATLSHSNPPNGVVGYVTLLLTNPGLATSLLPGVKWTGGAVPSFTASGKDLITLMCPDGANVYGSFLKDVR